MSLKSHTKDGSLYGGMMRSIHSAHSLGNTIRMVKLPLIFLNRELYAGAIAQFYHLSNTLETTLKEHQNEEIIQALNKLNLSVTGGYAADLQQLYGDDWELKAKTAMTPATKSYIQVLTQSNPVSLTAAAFILYGALVVGGGKKTQEKVRNYISNCDHALFDVDDDIRGARKNFRIVFSTLGDTFPQHYDTLVGEAARFMSLNNTVVISINCVSTNVKLALASVTVATAAFLLHKRQKR